MADLDVAGPGSSSLSELVLAGGVATRPGYFVLPHNDPLRFFLDLGYVESEEKLRGLDEATTPRRLA